MPFSPEQLGLLVSTLRRDLGTLLPEFVVDEKIKTWTMRSRDKDVAKQSSLVLIENGVSVIWGHECERGLDRKLTDSMCKASEETLTYIATLLQFVEAEYVFEFRTSENHYAVISDVFFGNGPLADVALAPRKHLTNDFAFRVLLDDARVLIIRATGSHNEGDIVLGRQGAEKLRIRVSVGQNDGFFESALLSVVDSHVKFVENLMESEIVPRVIEPLSQRVQRA